ncbi:DUF3426 domain-containing protein [Pseudomonas syringae group genomosp. 3]|uniref:Zinc finger/thioredoxin putative domain-containing protein n=1 Tax=Pseudomonas syringae pv. tomato (strain ATCC BAA-871 / DC3000) TaxID=223283 RepID=Q87VS2_PSESM|nr:DUF3426 domain-containing protein [Pseudomonas syringae group genomosp. 3]AAO58292.1 conserved hypothetical protein [Pseudomonas syringae pv. tomato str. DC3000]KKI25947.1 zinc finger-domain-containing protein [Pseudomonas syringae pv. persicae]KPB94374.1 Uncharacterized protein AC502_2812 [Pseudomonas syringae pv. maculicola]KPY92837.1 Uncharacterized protein ALO36_03146 [Pseudomonas syringae pv. tomato]MBF9243846.1 DUF3426 domain-containing protein [Pseudomonas syringae pv. tomato]
MTDSFVTQCPHCQTSFRVSHAQLSVARGVVRCGACLQVFNAARQLLEQRAIDDSEKVALAAVPVIIEQPRAEPRLESEPGPTLTPKPTSEPISETGEAPDDDDPWQVSEMDLDNLNLDEELARLEQRETRRPDTFASPASDIGNGNGNGNGNVSLTAKRDTRQADEAAWIDTVHNDDVEHLPELHAEVIDHTDTSEEPAPLSDNDRTEPSLSLDKNLDDDEPRVPVVIQHKALPVEKAERWSAVDDDDEDHDDHEPEPEQRGKRSRSEPAVRDQTLLDLTDDPLQLDWQRPKPRWGRRFAWGLLILLALAGLAVQYVWYHFDQLARQDQYRPWFQQICPQIGCKVPSKVDISQLKSSNLVVRSHPEFQGALVVDAIIYNRAPFSQPFPLLELRFSDTGGQLIASRRFKPSEYLSGEMAGKEEMPPQTPIHIALDILDPGAKAVNYSLNFRSPE